MNRYVKSVEKEITELMQQKPKKVESKGLLAPKQNINKEPPMAKSTRDFVVNLTADIRKARMAFKGEA